MSEHFFGLGHGRVSEREYKRIDRIAEKHGCSFTNPNMPGEGHRYWFSGPNRGSPFNEQMAKRVLAEVGEIVCS